VEPRDITNWLLENFSVNTIRGNEVGFPCPECLHKSFSFNVKKEIGHCFRVSCLFSPTIETLVDQVGSPVELSGYLPQLDDRVEKEHSRVSLPVDAYSIVSLNDTWAMQALRYRNITPDKIAIFNIHASREWIYVPVYEEGVLVQYVGRSIDRERDASEGFRANAHARRYDYFSGVPISNYLLGWGECKLWDSLTLVENTFNAIWLRYDLHCTTNFGSHLSKRQVDKIKRSKVKQVNIMFDYGAELRAEQAERRLTDAGVNVKVIHLPHGQPDDYELEYLRERVNG
jgi:hypothetical protein